MEVEADIGVFEAFARIAESNKITDTKWASASKLPQPRIGELRQIRRLMRDEQLTQAEASLKIRRKCTEAKIHKLYQGLSNLIGEDNMKREIEEAAKREKNQIVRISLYTRVLEGDKEGLDQLESLARMLATRIIPKKGK